MTGIEYSVFYHCAGGPVITYMISFLIVTFPFPSVTKYKWNDFEITLMAVW